MKMFKGTIEAVTMDRNAENAVRTSTETIVPAENRQGAMYAMLDMGQAMARSTNSVPGRTLYFRILEVAEVENKAEWSEGRPSLFAAPPTPKRRVISIITYPQQFVNRQFQQKCQSKFSRICATLPVDICDKLCYN